MGALLVGAIRLAIERNGREAGSIAKGLAALVVITGVGVPAVQVLTVVGDAYSNWILTEAANKDLGARLLQLSPAAGASTLSPIMLIGVSLFIFMAAMVQLMMLLAQSAGLVLLAGLLPLVAAAGISGSGQAVRNRYLTWLIALILYKPAAATIYAAVFWLGQGKTLTDLLTGLVMFCMAIVALPALLRLIAPAVSVLSSGGGASGAGVAAVSAAGQIASGAVRLSNSSGGKGSGGGSGSRTGNSTDRPVGASPPVPSQRPSDGVAAGTSTSASPGAAGGAAAGSGAAAGTSADTNSAAPGTAARTGAAAAAGPVGLAVAGGLAGTQASQAPVRKVGGTASGAMDGEGS
ncbi:hypothetical protein VAB18032_30324 (plasmid) [Micromonospora maris AB-18-032]|nr:hypothetical protein VAB18032_30324 [Micromonospora maris AB-18-032]